MYPNIKFRAKSWSALCNLYTEVIFWNICLRKYFLLFFVEFELLLLYNNTVKISAKKKKKKKNEQAELVENLPPSYLPDTFLHNLHSFLLWGKSENI